MAALTLEAVEKEITTAVEDVTKRFKIGANVTGDVCPGNIGIASQILITIMGRLGKKLDVTLPDNVYIFHDKTTHRQLSIKEAAQKFLTVVKNGKH